MEKQRGETIAGAGVDHDAPKPPANTRWANQQRVNITDWDGEGVSTETGRRSVCIDRRRRDKIRLFRRGGRIGQIDLDVRIQIIAERGFGDPSQEQLVGSNCIRGVRRGRAVFDRAGGGFLLDEGDEAGDVVFGGWCRVDVDLSWNVRRATLQNEKTYLALAIQQLHPPPRLGVTDSIVLALFIVRHGVE